MSEQQPQSTDVALELNNELQARREKLSALRENGVAFPNDFRRDTTSDRLHASFDEKSNEELEDLGVEVSVAGRMMTRRIMGKASFVTLQDVGVVSNFMLHATIWRKASTTSSLKSGILVTSWVHAASCSKPRLASCRFTVLNCGC